MSMSWRRAQCIGALAGFVVAPPALAAAPNCIGSEAFLVVEVPHQDSVGSRFIVRDKAASTKPACSTKPAKGDVIIGGPQDPYFLLKLAGRYLLIDAGTGPDRDLIIRDLRSGKVLFDGGYSDEDIQIRETRAIFWATTRQAPTRKNCADFASITKAGLTPVIETQASFDLATGELTRSTKARCVAHQ